MLIAVIPARGGSKTIPRKNLYPLCDKPLIQYTIEAAERSNLSDWILTTDDEEIAALTNKAIMRPPELARDDTPMYPVVKHAVEEYEKKNGVYGIYVDAVMLLQPTSPLRTSDDINRALEMFSGDCLVSVCAGIHPMKSYTSERKPFYYQNPFSKHVHRCWTRNGAIFITSRRLLDSGKLFNNNPLLYVMPKTRSIDIDDWEDLILAEAMLMRR